MKQLSDEADLNKKNIIINELEKHGYTESGKRLTKKERKKKIADKLIDRLSNESNPEEIKQTISKINKLGFDDQGNLLSKEEKSRISRKNNPIYYLRTDGSDGKTNVIAGDSIQCPVCSISLQAKRLTKHYQESHDLGPIDKVTTVVVIKRKTPKTPKLVIYSKRGTTLHGHHECRRCHKTVYRRMRYAESSWGPVVLCAKCKNRFRGSRGGDALTFRRLPGSFGTGKS